MKGLLAGLADGDPEVGVFDVGRGDGVVDPLVPDLLLVFQRPEGPQSFEVLRPLVDERALFTRKRHFVMVAFQEILPDFRADTFEQKPDARENRVVFQHRMTRLDQVVDPDARSQGADPRYQPAPERDTGRQGQAQRDTKHQKDEGEKSQIGQSAPSSRLLQSHCEADVPSGSVAGDLAAGGTAR